jgi:hypothetical protein
VKLVHLVGFIIETKDVLDYIFYHFNQLLDQNTTGILCRKIIVRPSAITLLGEALPLLRSLPTVVAISTVPVRNV